MQKKNAGVSDTKRRRLIGRENVPFPWMRIQRLSLVLLARSSARVTIFASDMSGRGGKSREMEEVEVRGGTDDYTSRHLSS